MHRKLVVNTLQDNRNGKTRHLIKYTCHFYTHSVNVYVYGCAYNMQSHKNRESWIIEWHRQYSCGNIIIILKIRTENLNEWNIMTYSVHNTQYSSERNRFFSHWLFHYLCVPFSCFATPMLLYFQHNEKFIVIRFSRLILFQAKCDLWLWLSWMEMVGTVSNFTDLPDALSHLGLVAWKTPFYL